MLPYTIPVNILHVVFCLNLALLSCSERLSDTVLQFPIPQHHTIPYYRKPGHTDTALDLMICDIVLPQLFCVVLQCAMLDYAMP